jgi:hypothetical protein
MLSTLAPNFFWSSSSDQLENAIVELNELKAQVIAVYGKEVAKEAIIHIESLTKVLELQMFAPNCF